MGQRKGLGDTENGCVKEGHCALLCHHKMSNGSGPLQDTVIQDPPDTDAGILPGKPQPREDTQMNGDGLF